MASTYSPTGSQPPSVELILRRGLQPGQRFSLTKQVIILGRDEGNDVVISHSEVSRRHASLTWDGTRFTIQDLGSANGTFVNGMRLTAPHVLQPGDVIGLGPTVQLDFQTPFAPVAAPVADPREAATHVPPRPSAPPVVSPPAPARRTGRRVTLPLLIALLGLCGLVAAAAVLGFLLLRPREVDRPLVLIRSPGYGEQLEVGQEITIHSIARGEEKITRVELWVDGQLHESRVSSLPGGSSPFPLLVRWQPASPGTHTLIARAFNAQGGRGQASVNVEAVERDDRDGDGVADEVDACPDDLGPPTADGCLDRDNDGIPDKDDACPDEAGLPAGDGCPVSGDRDRDGDGLLDEADVCPDEPGPPRADGCPDADSDGVRNSEDACPDEPGLPEDDGCLVPEDLDGDGVLDGDDACPDEPGLPEHAGCPDLDGDGIHDRDDECPAEPGLPEHAGCPDRDGDGVRDSDDACPDEPGPLPGGCPDTGVGDRDGDGVPDDVDDCPDDPGPGPSGCPEAGGPADTDTDEPSGPFGDLVPWPPEGLFGTLEDDVIILNPVEFEALEFEVYHEYQELHCYASLAGGDVERYDFEPLDERRWDIAEELGGENRRLVVVREDETSLEVQVECWATNIYPVEEEESPGGIPEGSAWGTVWDLGSFIQNHPRSDWDGHVLTASSAAGSDGHSFQAQYRICTDSCETAVFAPPLLLLTEVGPPGGGEPWLRALTWRWDGDESMINGFRLYVNGSYVRAFRPDQRSWELPSYLEPVCGERLEFHMTAFEGPTPVPNRESPRSNILGMEGPPCPRTVRVIFGGDTLFTHDLCCEDSPVGPVEGELWANDQQIEFDGSDLSLAGRFNGLWLESHNEYDIETQILHTIASWVDSCLGNGCPDYWAPWDNTLTTVIDADEDLTFGVRIYDKDRDGEFNWRCIFAPWLPCWLWWETSEVACEAEGTIPADEITTGVWTLYGDRCDLSVEIEELAP